MGDKRIFHSAPRADDACHEGYAITPEPYGVGGAPKNAEDIAARIATSLDMDAGDVKAQYAVLARGDFSYADCSPGEIKLPAEGIVISMRLNDGRWLNSEIHPHEWHLTPSITSWLTRAGAAFILVGLVAFLFVRRIARPLGMLTDAARSFGKALQVAEVDEVGPPDVRQMIQAFNQMQTQVADLVSRRTATLAAIGHDIRSPLTALRIKAELIDDPAVREDFLESVAKMECITQSALEYLKGDAASEAMKSVDLCSLVESECNEFIETGAAVSFDCEKPVEIMCRPDAVSRAVRNLIENAIKYAGAAKVSLFFQDDCATIRVSDEGPGIAPEDRKKALEPFQRLSNARETSQGGFGLGLAIAQSIAEGHGGALTLADSAPRGLVVELSLPARR